MARSELRERLRHARRELDPEVQRDAAEALWRQLQERLSSLEPSVVGAYLATDGEISPAVVTSALRRAGSRIAFPRIHDDVMTFHLVESDDQLVPGKWGLTEPSRDSPTIHPSGLDIALVPLVGFDAKLDRLGRGKAFYDRAFAFLGSSSRPAKPLLVGLAHDLQLVSEITARPHDIRLDAVVTPTRVYGSAPD